MTTIEAVKLAQQGKEEGYTALYNEFYKSKYYLALQYMKSEAAAEDVLQDAFVTAFKKINDLKDPASFGSWFKMIVTRTAINALRKNTNVTLTFLETEDADGEEYEIQIADESISNQPELSYTQKETQELVRAMIDSLSDEQRFCIMMFYLEDMSIKEIADTLECSENTVKSRLNYGRKNLMKQGEELKKKGYKLYSVSPAVLLAYLLKKESKVYAATTTVKSGVALAAAKPAFFATAGGKVVGVAVAVVVAGGAIGGGYAITQANRQPVEIASEKNTGEVESQKEDSQEDAKYQIPPTNLPDWKSPYTELLSNYSPSDTYTLVDLDTNGIPEIYILSNNHIDRFGYIAGEDGIYSVRELEGSLIQPIENTETIQAQIYTDTNCSVIFQNIRDVASGTERELFEERIYGVVINSSDTGIMTKEEGQYTYTRLETIEEFRGGLTNSGFSEVEWKTIDTPLEFDNGLQVWWTVSPYDLGEEINNIPKNSVLVLLPNSFRLGGTDTDNLGAMILGMEYPGQHSWRDPITESFESYVNGDISGYNPERVEVDTDRYGNTVYHLINADYMGYIIDMYYIHIP